MKEEKYMKAMKAHQDKLYGYALRLHELVDEMLEDNASTNDVLGVLEAEKMWRFQRTLDGARAKTLEETIGELADILFDDEEE